MMSNAVGRTSRRPKKNYSFYRVSYRWGTMSKVQFLKNLKEQLDEGKISRDEYLEQEAEMQQHSRITMEAVRWIHANRVPWYDPNDKKTRCWANCIVPSALPKMIAILEAIPGEQKPHNVEIRSPLGDVVYRCTHCANWRTHRPLPSGKLATIDAAALHEYLTTRAMPTQLTL